MYGNKRATMSKSALLNQGMNANCAGSRAKVSLGLGFKNPRKENSYLKSATPFFSVISKQ
jgi:hypothetical protein